MNPVRPCSDLILIKKQRSPLLFALKNLYSCAPAISGNDTQLGSILEGGIEQVVAATGGQNLWPFLIYALSVAALLGAVLILAWLISTKSRHTETTDLPFESGVLPVGKAEETRMSIEFYLIAMFFVIFDLETIFIIAWAVAFFELGWQGYIGASLFIVILLVALVYELRTGALDWGVLRRRERGGYAVTRATVEPQ